MTETGHYSWGFYTGGRAEHSILRKCYRGPMTDVEKVLGAPFTVLTDYNFLRDLTLTSLVDTDLVAVQTRECVLRVLRSPLWAIFVRLHADQDRYPVTICERKNASVIEALLAPYDDKFSAAALNLYNYGIHKQHVNLLTAGLISKTLVVRVAARCAIILLATLVEIDQRV